jgi:hypothetical protein
MSRKFSDNVSDVGKQYLVTLADITTGVSDYSNALYQLGKALGNVLCHKIGQQDENICVACTVEDADFLAKGVIESLNACHSQVSLACFWNQRQQLSFAQQTLSIAPIIRKYREPEVDNARILVIVKSVISGACVVKTNLTYLIQEISPEVIFVVSPVIHSQAIGKLEQEFPKTISEKFQYIYFAEDNEKLENGNLVPGIGGSVYQRLGFKDQEDKNRFTPDLVKTRREQLVSEV